MRSAVLVGFVCVAAAAAAGCFSKPTEPGAPSDALPDTPADACVFGAWNAPQLLTSANSSYDERSPWMSTDGRELYFIRASNPHYLRHMHREDTTVMTFFGFDTLMDLPPFYGMNPHFSDDQKRVWITTEPALNTTTLQYAERAAITDAFGPAQTVSELDASAYEQDPTLTADELTMVFASARMGSIDLFVTTRAQTTDPWGTPRLLTMTSDGGTEASPWINADGSLLLFSSNRDGVTRIYQSQRLVATQPESFGPISLFEGTGGMAGVQDPFLSRDGRVFIFTQDVKELWYSTRSCL